MSTSQVRPQVTTIAVALAVRNQVTRFGVEHILRQLSAVCRIRAESDGADVLIAALNDTARNEIAISLTATRAGGTKVLILLDGSADRDVTRAASVCCDGFLDIGELTAETMADALHQVVRGGLPMPEALTKDLLAHVRAGSGTGPRTPAVSLTPRELQVLSLMMEGLSTSSSWVACSTSQAYGR
jgi:DNA-binding NarL/FixJ family response regulator